MLNYLWSFMVIFSILMAAFGGDMAGLTTEMLASSQSAVKICFDTCGILAMWMGIMYIAEPCCWIPPTPHPDGGVPPAIGVYRRVSSSHRPRG